MAIVQRPIQRQEFRHAPLWSTYLPSGPRRGRTARSRLPQDDLSLEEALAEITDLWGEQEARDRTRLALIGTALWNLVDADAENSQPAKLSTLLFDVLQLDVERARKLRALPGNAVFPPFPETFNDRELPVSWPVGRLISDSDFTAQKNKRTARYATHARLEVCVEGDFEKLSQITDPTTWPDLSPAFWADMRRTDDVWKGGLRLPGDDQREIVDVVLAGVRAPDATRTDAELHMLENQWISGGVFHFHVTPEPSRPGWTRIIHERDVTFVSPALRKYQVESLAYWTKSEIACLALI